jgi:hypothetical protein
VLFQVVAQLPSNAGNGDLWPLERPTGMVAIQSLEVMCGKEHMDVHLKFSGPFDGLVFSKVRTSFSIHRILHKTHFFPLFPISRGQLVFNLIIRLSYILFPVRINVNEMLLCVYKVGHKWRKLYLICAGVTNWLLQLPLESRERARAQRKFLYDAHPTVYS